MSDGTQAITNAILAPGIVSGRLGPDDLAKNFADLHAPLSGHEALVEADRCYFCFDAPCQIACPTTIDIPLFIRQIATGNALGSAKTIFEQNILGGMCARVCPTETLCEEVCVRLEAEGQPVRIGQLQRYATDQAIENGVQFFRRGPGTGRKIAIIGAGPAGLACAHRLAVHGHSVTIFDAHEKPGGLNEYGIAAYKSVDDFARKEVEYVTAIGGIEIKTGQALGTDLALGDLTARYDAVFVGAGMAGANELGLADADTVALDDAIDFISVLRQADDLADLPIGRRVVVVGGGMTAIDAAVQAKALGAEEVTICYRRSKSAMNASTFEQELATSRGVTIRHTLAPRSLVISDGALAGIVLEYTTQQDGRLSGTGQAVTLAADQVFAAIGQHFDPGPFEGLALQGGKIKIDANGRTTMAGVWAGGDCATGGDDLTVTAVAEGRDAAENIHEALIGEQG
jgi:dihydropyrimidine dehydrogenase (NAD+) subunit PreT